MQPVGMAGEQGLPEQSQRVGKKLFKNQAGAIKGQKPGYHAAVDKESALHYFGRVTNAQILAGSAILAKNLILAAKEARAAGRYQITEDIAKVSELGIPIHIVTAYGDEMFDQAKVDAGYEDIADFVNGYSTVATRRDDPARHDTFWLQPKRTAQIVSQLTNQSSFLSHNG
jgi:hypothetical protein